MNYRFSLFDGNTLLDDTNIDEDDPEFALTLFLSEFGYHNHPNKENLYVLLDEATEEVNE